MDCGLWSSIITGCPALPYPASRQAVCEAAGAAASECLADDSAQRLAAGLRTKVSPHSFRATGITTYLQNGGKLEIAQRMAGHESSRTTRRDDAVALDEVERIAY
jgi:integrase